MIRVRSTKPGGFWRAGRHFGPGWQEFPNGGISSAELAVLKAEPMLVVEEVPDPAAAKPAAVAVEIAAKPAAASEPEPMSQVEPESEDEPGRKKKGK